MKTFLAFLLVTSLASAGLAQDDSAVKKEVFDKALATYENYYANANEHVRKSAVDDFGDVNHPLTIPVLLEALKDKSEVVRESVGPALTKQTSKPGLAVMTQELQAARDEETRLVILETFKTTRPKVAYDLVLKLSEDKNFAVRLVAAEILGLMPSEKGKSERALLELLKDRDAQMRLVAIDSLTKLGYEDLVDLSLDLMKNDKDWRVQATAIASLRRFRLKRTIEPLMDAMENGEGRLRDDAHQALVDITQTTYGPKPEVWRKWWARVKDGFTVPTAEEIEEQKKREAASNAAYGGKREYDNPFRGVDTKSARILFVLDVSGSMKDKLVLEGGDPERMAAFKERYGSYETKIDLAREELINTIATLEPHVKFNIITFNAEVNQWKPKLVTTGSKGAAIKFLSKLTPQWIEDAMVKEGKGGTNTFGALNLALGLKDIPNEVPTKNHKVESDTVFFLSDGMPTVGRIRDPQELLRYFDAVNQRAKIVFHTLTFGHGNVALLKPLAERSGGKYIEISVD
ncbi:MAG: HEAT repeat domain-containing protein [Planctomycetes bacterium]|nr:HEAT repeat domain-containing protein [Planctomycetota bacterium]